MIIGISTVGDVLCCSNHQRNKYFHMYLDKMLSKEVRWWCGVMRWCGEGGEMKWRCGEVR